MINEEVLQKIHQSLSRRIALKKFGDVVRGSCSRVFCNTILFLDGTFFCIKIQCLELTLPVTCLY